MSDSRDKEGTGRKARLLSGQPETPGRRQGRAVIAGQDEQEGGDGRYDRGGEGRADYPLAESERAEPEIQQDEESRQRDEIAGGAHGGPGFGNEDRDMVHDAGNSFALTLALAMPLAVCALGPGTAGWKHIAVAAGYYGILFAFSSWAARRWGGKEGVLARTVFMESRIAVVLIGFAAVGFGSPVLLEIAPDVLAVTIAGSGLADGRSVGLLARGHGCSVLRVSWVVLSDREARRKAS